MSISDTVQPPALAAHSARLPDPLARIWPQAIVTLGLGLSVVWTCFLGYGFVKLVQLAI
jgi:hypothetical protein